MAVPPYEKATSTATSGFAIPGWTAVLVVLLALAGVLTVVLIPLFTPRPQPSCRTPCGLRVYAARPLDCSMLGAYETRVLATFESRLPEWPRAKTCPLLNGWGLQVVPNDGGGRYVDAYDRTISGQTFLEARVVQVADLGTDDWRQSAFAHELAHAFEFYLDNREPDYEHASWEARGIYPAINELSR